MNSHAPTSPHDYARAIHTHPERARLVFAMEINGQRVWVKRSQKKYSSKLQRLLHRLSGKATVKTRLKRELAAMERLHQQGALVSTLLYRSDDYIVLSDLGPTLHDRMLSHPPEAEKRNMLLAAADALRNLHQHGGFHGNPKLMDLTLHETGAIGFLDFEEASDGIVPLRLKQALDLWLFAHSIVRFDQTGTLSRDVIRHYGTHSQTRLLRAMGYALWPLYCLLGPIENWAGRDVRFARITTRAVLTA